MKKNFVFLLIVYVVITLCPVYGVSNSQDPEPHFPSLMLSSTMNVQPKPNRLINEKSPYLRQHAYNPVNWYPWGRNAFTRAQTEHLPIFLSIGYSTCHWCHVMEEESFENREIADFLNANFVSIKVDREERPDIDQIYMLATQAMTGYGGWPMSVFLFPNKKPFFSGTYFPPTPQHGQPGFLDVLKVISKTWKSSPERLEQSADKITSFLKDQPSTLADSLDNKWIDLGFTLLEKDYDPKHGGFGQINKFPRTSAIDFLLIYHRHSNDSNALKMANDTLSAMASGGIYDHVGGGFHRYSVDRQWRIPHFEKMLYDQAQLITTYLKGYQLTKNIIFGNIARHTIEYLLRDMQHPLGGFYAAEDADSLNPYNPNIKSEGAFYLWKQEELETLLDKKGAEIFTAAYGVKENGNALNDPTQEFSGSNILYLPQPLPELSSQLGISLKEISQSLAESQDLLLQQRQKRKRPHRDDKIITSWNGLMVSALAKSGIILKNKQYIEEAKRTTSFITTHLMDNTILKRRWSDGEARFSATLKDYAFFIQGLLDLYQATHDLQYLKQAIKLSETQITLFTDPEGGFYDSISSQDLLVRMKESYDGAQPTGNSVSALNFIRLSLLTGNKKWQEIGKNGIKSFGLRLKSQPNSLPLMLSTLYTVFEKPIQIVITGSIGNAETHEMLEIIHNHFLPHSVILLADMSENQKYLEQYIPELKNMKSLQGISTAYVCKNFLCKAPTNDPEKLATILEAM